MMLQDKYTRDSFKIINSSKEVKGNLVQSVLKHFDQLTNKQEIHLFSSIFSHDQMEAGKVISLALSQIHYLVKDLKEELAAKKKS
jgi:hypothetical protein